MQRDEVVRRDRRAGVVEGPRVVGELERLEAERAREPEAALAGVGRLGGDGGKRAVELLGPARTRERLQRMHREAAGVRLERRERRRTGDVGDPRAGLEIASDRPDRGVGNAEQDELRVRPDGDAALAQPGGDGRADAARADDVD